MRLSNADFIHVGQVCRPWSKLTRDGVSLVVRTAPQRLVQTLKHISDWQPQGPPHTYNMSVRVSDSSSPAEMDLKDWESYLKDLCRQVQVGTCCFVCTSIGVIVFLMAVCTVQGVQFATDIDSIKVNMNLSLDPYSDLESACACASNIMYISRQLLWHRGIQLCITSFCCRRQMLQAAVLQQLYVQPSSLASHRCVRIVRAWPPVNQSHAVNAMNFSHRQPMHSRRAHTWKSAASAAVKNALVPAALVMVGLPVHLMGKQQSK